MLALTRSEGKPSLVTVRSRPRGARTGRTDGPPRTSEALCEAVVHLVPPHLVAEAAARGALVDDEQLGARDVREHLERVDPGRRREHRVVRAAGREPRLGGR